MKSGRVLLVAATESVGDDGNLGVISQPTWQKKLIELCRSVPDENAWNNQRLVLSHEEAAPPLPVDDTISLSASSTTIVWWNGDVFCRRAIHVR